MTAIRGDFVRRVIRRVGRLLVGLALMLAVLPGGESSAAEVVVRLQSGRELVGEQVAESSDTITLNVRGLRMTLNRADIAEVVAHETPVPSEAIPSPTPMPDWQALLERAAHEWGARFVSGDFGGAWDRSSRGVQESVSKEQYVALCRRWFGEFASTEPGIRSAVAENGRALVRMKMPPNPGAQDNPEAWPWRADWIREEGEWRQTLHEGDPVLDAMTAIRLTPTPTPTPRTVHRAPEPEPEAPRTGRGESRIIEYAAPTPTPEVETQRMVDESAVSGETDAMTFEPPDALSLHALWGGLDDRVRTVLVGLLAAHVLCCLAMYVDTRRRQGRALVTFLWALAGGLLTLCPPLTWAAYLIVRAKS